MTLDHLIAVVPDLRATHRRLIDAGFDEAWPAGPFWPSATTSGIALGGANLELVQTDEGVPSAKIETIVLAPATLEEGEAVLNDLGLMYEEREKIEPDPSLLALRGFPPELASSPQRICTNQLPVDPPYPFFHCCYAPFLKERLAPERFDQPRGPIVALHLTSPDPEAVRRLFAGHLGPIELDVEFGSVSGVAAIHFADGSTLSSANL
jgi:hypothetical protein